jgi:AcrR family transcriptional regulator
MATTTSDYAPASDHLREDARRNRLAILQAARELFAESADVPMCEVARRAGVGQATLYRNFSSRSTLAAEVLGEHVDRFAQLAVAHEADPDAFFILLRALVETVVQTHALSSLAREDACVGSRLEFERERIAELMKGPLCEAKTAGTLRRDTSVDDVFLILLMAKGAMERAPGPAARATAAARVLTLALDGLAAAGARA